MKIRNSVKMIALSVVASTLFVGCGSSDDTAAPVVAAPLTGTFVDAPVQGLTYKTPSQNGFTDASGQFKYLSGEEVEFMLGNLSLGKGSAGTLMTPYTITDNNDTVTNIALLLQNFDNDRTDTILDLSLLQDANLSDVNLTATASDMETKIGNLFSDTRFSTNYSGSVLLDSTTVKGAMDTYIEENSINYDKQFTQAYLDKTDFYATDKELGTPQIQRFVGGQLYYAGDSYKDDNGILIAGAGYDGTFNIDGSGIAGYTITDGIISIGYGGGSFIVTTKILNVGENYIEVSQTADGQTFTSIWFIDEAAAKTDLYERAFNKKGIVYIIASDSTRTTSENVTYATYTSTSLDMVSRVTGENLNYPLSITDGIFVVDFGQDSTDYVKVLSVSPSEALFCSRDTLDEAKVCTKADYAFVF